jgi:hypothetical protein
MAKPLKWKSLDNASETGPGVIQATKGHDEFALYVRAFNGFDPSTDTLTVRVEGSESEEDFAPIDRGAPETPNSLSVSEDDFTESEENAGVFASYIGSNSFPIDNLRANCTSHSGGFNVDAYVYVLGSSQASYRFQEPDRGA